MSIITVLLLLMFPVGLSAEKPYKMVMLNIIQTGASKPQNGRTCRAALQYVLDRVNNQTEVLPDYQLSTQNEDESGGDITPSIVVTFSRNFAAANGDTIYPSPVMTGPFLSGSCKAIGTFLDQVNMTAISTVCAAAELANHRRYPNMYLMASTVPLIMAMVNFMKFVGGWKRIVLITTPLNVLDYTTAIYIQNTAISAGISVPYFVFAPDMDDEQMRRLKETESRIFVVYSSNVTYVSNFLCQAFKFGFTGPRYLFLSRVVFMDPYQLPAAIFPGCTRAIIIEQLQYTFFSYAVGVIMKGQEANVAKYEEWLARALNNTQPVDYTYKDLCHDTFTRAVVALDRANKKLKNFNMSLRDFRSNPGFVMKIVNESASNTDYTGLDFAPQRTGHGSSIIQGAIYYYTRKGGLQVYYRLEQFANTDESKFDSYEVLNLIKYDWASYGGRPPLDAPTKTTETKDSSDTIFIAVVCIASTFIAVKLGVIVEAVYRGRKVAGNPWRTKVLGYFGCILLDVAAILLATKTSYWPYAIWIARIAVLVSGLSTVNSVLSLRVLVLYSYMARSSVLNERIQSRSRSRSAASRNSQAKSRVSSAGTAGTAGGSTVAKISPHVNLAAFREAIHEADKMTLKLAVCLVVSYSAVALIWLTIDPLRCSIQKLGVDYLAGKDIQRTTFEHVCLSDGHLIWILAMYGSQLLLFIYSIFVALKTKQNFPKCPELTLISFGLNNTFVALLGIVLVLAILNGQQVNQLIAIAFGVLAISMLSTLSWAWELLKH